MKKKIERNEPSVIWVIADFRQQILFVPKMVKDRSRVLGAGESRLYFEYKKRYPTFAEVIV